MIAKFVDPPETMADLHERLGFVPLHRIRMDPPPGRATEADVIRHLDGGNKRMYELVDGTLVEKAVGTLEAILAIAIATRINNYAEVHDLGLVSGADGPFRMLHGNVRYPDVSFIPWSAFTDEEIPSEAIWSIVPERCVWYSWWASSSSSPASARSGRTRAARASSASAKQQPMAGQSDST